MKRDIAHVLVGLGYGGIETWLVNIFRNHSVIRDRSRIILIGREPQNIKSYRDEIKTMGIPIDHVILPKNTPLGAIQFIYSLSRWLKKNKVEIIHSHINYLSGLVTLSGHLAGVPKRLAHYHVTFPADHKTPLRKAYIFSTRLLEAFTASSVLGCSLQVINDYRPITLNQSKHAIYYGINLTPFGAAADGGTLRSELKIPPDAFVIGHVGRFAEQKNHRFLIEIAAEVCHHDRNARFLLVGDGPLRPRIEQQVAQAGLGERVIFAGLRADVPALMSRVMDAFLFPSLYEGLPVTLIEVQAAGLPAVISDTITEETDLIKPLLQRLSLDQPADEWAQAVLACRDRKGAVTPAEALDCVRHSHFNIEQSIRNLMAVYDG